jgi:8-amino-7-oxononanoate synthase
LRSTPARLVSTSLLAMEHSTHHPLAWINPELESLQQQGLRRFLAIREGCASPKVVIDGQELVHFGSNDYLGLAADPRIVQAVVAAVTAAGWGSGASPLVSGHSAKHAELQRRLAAFEGTEAALVFSSGFAANSGTIAALVGPGDVVFTDRKNHASLLDGCRLSRADVRAYPHRDWQGLARLLDRKKGCRRRLIVTDSLFSMDGDLSPLAELVDLADRYEAMLMIDEAHATGVFGPGGRGVAEHFGLEDRVPIRVGTLSKALGGQGGFVAGSRALVEWLINRARSYIYSTACPAATAAAALVALNIVECEPERRRSLLERAAELRASLTEQGWDTGGSESQIIPIAVGDPRQAVELASSLRQKGFFVPAIRPPTVPEGEACLRISLTYAHTPEMIESLLAALRPLRGET